MTDEELEQIKAYAFLKNGEYPNARSTVRKLVTEIDRLNDEILKLKAHIGEARAIGVNACPYCAKILDPGTHMCWESREYMLTNPGDLSVCEYCATPIIFDEKIGQRTMEPSDKEELNDDRRKWLDKLWKETAVRVGARTKARAKEKQKKENTKDD